MWLFVPQEGCFPPSDNCAACSALLGKVARNLQWRLEEPECLAEKALWEHVRTRPCRRHRRQNTYSRECLSFWSLLHPASGRQLTGVVAPTDDRSSLGWDQTTDRGVLPLEGKS